MLIAILYARKLRPIVCVRLKVSELNWPGEIKKYRNFDIDDFPKIGDFSIENLENPENR